MTLNFILLAALAYTLKKITTSSNTERFKTNKHTKKHNERSIGISHTNENVFAVVNEIGAMNIWENNKTCKISLNKFSKTKNTMITGIAINDYYIVTGTDDGKLYIINRTTNLQSQIQHKISIISTPILMGDNIIAFQDIQGSVYVIDISGKILHSIINENNTARYIFIPSTSIIADENTIYIFKNDDDNTFETLNVYTGERNTFHFKIPIISHNSRIPGPHSLHLSSQYIVGITSSEHLVIFNKDTKQIYTVNINDINPMDFITSSATNSIIGGNNYATHLSNDGYLYQGTINGNILRYDINTLVNYLETLRKDGKEPETYPQDTMTIQYKSSINSKFAKVISNNKYTVWLYNNGNGILHSGNTAKYFKFSNQDNIESYIKSVSLGGENLVVVDNYDDYQVINLKDISQDDNIENISPFSLDNGDI